MTFHSNHLLRSLVRALVGSVLILSGGACRTLILEDRSVCPTIIRLRDVPSLDPEEWAYMKLSLWKDWTDDAEELVRMDELNEGHDIEWRKEHLFQATAITGWDGVIEGNGTYLIPYGGECPTAMGGYVSLPVEGDESYLVDLPVRSLYANVFFEISGAASGYPFDIRVRGAVDGYDLPYLHLHKGPFECATRTLSYKERSCRIPRQDEAVNDVATKAVYAADLKSDFYFQEESTGQWQKFYSLPLGEIITMNGYNWSDAVLEDIHVNIHLADGAITRLEITVADWTVVVIGDGKLVI